MSRIAHGKKTILVVDDDPDILASLHSYMGTRLPDVSVITTASGPKAVAVLNAQPIDLILTDYRMPEMDGVEFLRHARQIQADIPMLIMTAYNDPDLAEKAMRIAGVRTIFSKPFDLEHLGSMVEGLLAAQDTYPGFAASQGVAGA